MRRTASEILSDLEIRIANLESTTKIIANPVLLSRSPYPELELIAPKSEIKNIEGYGKMCGGTPSTQHGQIGSGANPMKATAILFVSEADLEVFIKRISRTYTVIETY